MVTDVEIVKAVKTAAEAEAEKWLQSTLEKSKSKHRLYASMWELGKVKKDGTDIERMLHHLTYEYFSRKAKAIISLDSTQN